MKSSFGSSQSRGANPVRMGFEDLKPAIGAYTVERERGHGRHIASREMPVMQRLLETRTQAAPDAGRL